MHLPSLVSVVFLAALQASPVNVAASRFVPNVTWRTESVLTADFSCRGRKEQAILGSTVEEIVIAVFVNGTNERPKLLRYSATARDARTAKLTLESLDYDPEEEAGGPLRGFQRSKTCKGLNLSDQKIDSAHIYWNHNANEFDDWVR